MKKIKYIIPVMVTMAATIIATDAVAQDPTTLQSIERRKLESLWFSNTDNAAGAQSDKMDYFSSFGIEYNHVSGGYKRAQSGLRSNGYGFSTDGGGSMESLKGTFLWGYFNFNRDKIQDAEYNASLIDPLRGMPFFVADENKSNWINQDYRLGLKAATPLLFRHWTVGIGLDYENAQGAKQLDPRPKMLLSKFTVTPSVTYTVGKHTLGADFRYYSRREDGSASNSNNFINQHTWEVVYPGFFSETEIGGGQSSVLRFYNANSMGGGLQYGYRSDRIKLLLSSRYAYTVEDVDNNYTTPKTIGTTKTTEWEGRIGMVYTFRSNHMFVLDACYTDRSIDGIEYVQVFDNTTAVNKWQVLSKHIRSNFSTRHATLTLDYLYNRSNSYLWRAGFSADYENLSDIYYIPRSTQDIDNLRFEGHVKKNFFFGDNTIHANLCAMIKSNTDAEHIYTGYNPESRIYTDMVLRDYDYLRSDAYGIGGEISYSRCGIISERSTFFISARADWCRPFNNPESRFNHRLNVVVKAGLTF